MHDDSGISTGRARDLNSSGRNAGSGMNTTSQSESSVTDIPVSAMAAMHGKRTTNTTGMHLDVTEDYIRATMTGGTTLSLPSNAIETIMQAVEIHDCYRILIDSRRQYADPSIVDCFEFAKKIASHKPWLNFLVGVIVHIESFEAAEFAEVVARNRGIILKIFSHDTAAIKWLRNGRDDPTATR